MKRLTFLAISIVFAVVQCSNKQNNFQDSLLTQKDIDAQSAVVTGNNQFSNDLLKNYLNSEDQKSKNIFFSPFSIYSALAMTSEGAKGLTEKEMQQVLHIPADAKHRQSGMKDLMLALSPNTTNYKLDIANALWAQKGYSFHKKYTTVSTASYNAKVENLDFIQQPDAALKTINSWVEENTNNKIKDLLSKSSITNATRLILTNAIYFKADWDEPFHAEFNKEKEFITASAKKVKVQMMRRTSSFKYAETNEAQILELPYKEDNVSMIFLLPKKGQNIQSVAGKSSNFEQECKNKFITLSLPKFKLEASYMLKDDLVKMGMPSPFSENADLSGISNSKELSIGQVIHKTFIEVNETGTEAGAATAIDIKMGSPIPIDFIIDHPFIFMIRHNSTATILFTGVVNDPTKQ